MTTITLNLPDHLVQAITNIGEQLPVVLEMGIASATACVSSIVTGGSCAGNGRKHNCDQSNYFD